MINNISKLQQIKIKLLYLLVKRLLDFLILTRNAFRATAPATGNGRERGLHHPR